MSAYRTPAEKPPESREPMRKIFPLGGKCPRCNSVYYSPRIVRNDCVGSIWLGCKVTELHNHAKCGCGFKYLEDVK